MSSEFPQHWCEPRVILVAVNLDDQPALMRYAVAEARRSGARLLLVHVIPPPLPRKDAAISPPRVLLLPSTHAAAEALDHLALRLQWQGVLAEPIVLKGRPNEQIQTLVQSRKVDRVIVAARSGLRLEPSSGRSVAEHLMASLPVPVCVIGSRSCPEMPHDAAMERVLLALSLRTDRKENVDFAFGVARARNARLTLLHVIDPSSVGSHERARAHEPIRLRLAALAATHDELSWQPDISVREGDPALQIVEEAACPFRDLIILGSSSLTPFPQGRESNLIDRVIAETRCPVLVLKPPVGAVRAEPVIEWQALKTGSLN